MKRLIASIAVFALAAGTLLASSQKKEATVIGGSNEKVTFTSYVRVFYLQANAGAGWKILTASVSGSGWLINVRSSRALASGQIDYDTEMAERFSVVMNGTIVKPGGDGEPPKFALTGDHDFGIGIKVEPEIVPLEKKVTLSVVSPAEVDDIITWTVGRVNEGTTVYKNKGKSFEYTAEKAGNYAATVNYKGVLFHVVEVKSLSGGGVKSVTSSPSYAESIVVDTSTGVTLTALPTPGTSWPSDYPKWYVNGNSVQTGGSTYTLSTTANGKYEVSVECGNKKAMNIYAVDCQFQIVVDTPANGAIDIQWDGIIPVSCSVGHTSWRLNVIPSEAVNVAPLSSYSGVLRKNIGFHANDDYTSATTGEVLAPKPTTHIPDDEAAGKLRAYAISLNDLCAGAAFSAARASNAGDYRLGTLGAAIYKGSALIAWAHATTRNCTTFGLDAGAASGVTLPSAFGYWTGTVAGITLEYEGEMPYVLYPRI